MPNPNNPPTVPPAYATYSNLRDRVAEWKEHGLPDRIDRSILSSMSGGAAGSFMQALKFLGLTDDTGRVTPAAHGLVDAFGAERWPEAVRALVQSAYGTILGDFNPRSGTPSTLRAKFRDAGVQDGQMLDKTCRFYVNMLEDAQVEVNKYLKDMKPTYRAPKPMNTPRKGGDVIGDDEIAPPAIDPAPVPPSVPEGYIDQPLLFPGKLPGRIVFPADLTPTDVKLIEAAFTYLRAYAEASRNPE